MLRHAAVAKPSECLFFRFQVRPRSARVCVFARGCVCVLPGPWPSVHESVATSVYMHASLSLVSPSCSPFTSVSPPRSFSPRFLRISVVSGVTRNQSTCNMSKISTRGYATLAGGKTSHQLKKLEMLKSRLSQQWSRPGLSLSLSLPPSFPLSSRSLDLQDTHERHAHVYAHTRYTQARRTPEGLGQQVAFAVSSV